MTYIVGAVLIMLCLLLLGCVGVIVALLKRLDSTNLAFKQAADSTMAQALAMQKQGPKQLEVMLNSLATATSKIHETIQSTVQAVMQPPVVQVDQGMGGMPYAMPTIQGDGQDAAPWDHTDRIMQPQGMGPVGVVGYEHENDPDFDPSNVFGIPGMVSVGM